MDQKINNLQKKSIMHLKTNFWIENIKAEVKIPAMI